MPISQKYITFCDSCGKLMKVEKFGDALSPKDLELIKALKKKRLCGKCKMKNRFTNYLHYLSKKSIQ